VGQTLSSLLIRPAREACWRDRTREFWRKFTSPDTRPKLVFGRNEYAQSILELCPVDGFVDDFSKDRAYCGRPIIRTADIPADALVLAASGGKPLTVRQKLDEVGVEHLDYFSLSRWSGAPLRDIVFNEGFREEFLANEAEYEWVFARLGDDLSRQTFRRLVSFRFSCDLDVMRGFSDRQDEQYFEAFLNLRRSGEVFADVGSFDGQTTLEFVKRCPEYGAAYVLEPDPVNFSVCKQKLAGLPNICMWPIGASDAKGKASFTASGSKSGISPDGPITIELDCLDDLLSLDPTFIKMDIEGAELPAIMGATRIIRHRPRMAVCAYHRPGDFWRIPKQVLAIFPNFDLYMRHYTESIYETVIFFVPADRPI
jgi:FkbM family methyltransferase